MAGADGGGAAQSGGRDIAIAHAVDGGPGALVEALEAFPGPGCRVAFDTADLGGGSSCEVSTVELVWEPGAPHFETMVFVDGRGARFAQRYTNREAAERGHEQVLAAVHAGLLDRRLSA